jgi:hypothetical protein
VLKGLAKFWRDLTCEDDGNTTYCPIRVGGLGVITSYLGLSAHHIFTSHTFDYVGFATGGATILGVLAGGIGAKSKLGADRT